MTKIQLRNLWFQVHKWMGLSLAVLIIPISVTGAALVWHEPILEAMHPERHHASAPAALPPAAYADAAREALGEGERLSRLDFANDAPVVATATQPGKGRPQRVLVYLDPETSRVIARENSSQGAFQVMHVLHGSLMLPGVGRQIVGWIGVAMLLSSMTGLWLWWPTAGSLKRAFRWGRHRNLDHNIHQTFGFWVSLPLFVLSLTGVWISFPAWFAGVDGPQSKGPDRGAMLRARPLAAPTTPLADALARAQAAAPGTLRSVAWPTDQKREWTFEVATTEAPASVSVADAGGAAKVTPKPAEPQRETVARLMRRIHDGNGMGLAWQIVIFLGGLIPAALAVTGIIMWWRARGWRGEVAARKAQA
jgi:uncharacterized iron-regulated membrane protein